MSPTIQARSTAVRNLALFWLNRGKASSKP